MKTLVLLGMLTAVAACGPTLSSHRDARTAARASTSRAALTGAAAVPPATAMAAPAVAARAPRDAARAVVIADTARPRPERPVARERDGVRGPNLYVPRATDVFGPPRYPRIELPRK